MKKLYITSILLLLTSSSFAYFPNELNELVGYTILGNKKIVGWYDQDGKRGQSFEGCNYGRTIVFEDNKILICRNYHYHYGYRAEALILSDGQNFKMMIDDHVYNMSLQ